ncbi:N-acetyltransferase [Enterovibrio paralichthyis]|uniref:N-acetyltransferase n=1 Tax=Enterovibrio paralichthyis TaxID=2853805 RepID=UPI001C469C26|nr:N-acetyltransferase [Enterovibrio paralichthyis]MBV7296435.1 N-acetyltransferase [Enterovibrio paralichthyis]
MIRAFRTEDMDAVLAIWLQASIKAHDFVDASFWRGQVENMRNMYIPASECYVFERDGEVAGFYALYEDFLPAIFVSPEHQRRGIGKALLDDAKSKRSEITLSVYKENPDSVGFYQSQGFAVVSEQDDEHTGHPELTMQWSSN